MQTSIVANKTLEISFNLHQLFKLQKTYFGDKRFVLDSRFLESDEDDEAAADDYRERVTGERKRVKSKEPVNTHDEDDTSRSLKEEKEMELRVLGSILGTDLRAEFDQEEIQVKESGFRYFVFPVEST